jgi:ribosomal protein L37AE/L43A
VIIVLAWWVIYLHLRPPEEKKREKFRRQFSEFVPKFGVWTHKTEQGYFCPACKEKLVESQMTEVPQGWSCPLCKYWAGNPEYKQPGLPATEYVDVTVGIPK